MKTNICSKCGAAGANFFYGAWYCLECFDNASKTHPTYCPFTRIARMVNGVTIVSLGFCHRDNCMAYIYVKSCKQHYCKAVEGGCYENPALAEDKKGGK